LNSVASTYVKFITNKPSFSATAYAIKAIKRRYNLIPLAPVQSENPRLTLVNPINSSARIKKYG
jgi:hypothetical protein